MWVSFGDEFCQLFFKLFFNRYGSAKSPHIPFVQVDAHNIVPCWVASAKLDPQLDSKLNPIDPKIEPKIDPKIEPKLDPKLEISALLPQFLTPIPALQANPPGSLDCEKVDWKRPWTVWRLKARCWRWRGCGPGSRQRLRC